MKMKLTMRLFGILIASVALVACGGGSGGKPVKTEKVWKLVKKEFLDESDSMTFDYNGSGLLIKQIFPGYGYYEFIYNTQGVLLKKELFTDASGKIVSYEEFDKYGEVTRRLKIVDGSFKETIVYINKYPDDLEIKNKEIQQYTQRKILQTWVSNELFPYLDSKLISRIREVTIERIEEFDFSENNKLIIDVFEYPDDRAADKVLNFYYDRYGIRLLGQEYDYVEDGNGNLELTTHKITGSRIRYTWKQMDVPVE